MLDKAELQSRGQNVGLDAEVEADTLASRDADHATMCSTVSVHYRHVTDTYRQTDRRTHSINHASIALSAL